MAPGVELSNKLRQWIWVSGYIWRGVLVTIRPGFHGCVRLEPLRGASYCHPGREEYLVGIVYFLVTIRLGHYERNVESESFYYTVNMS